MACGLTANGGDNHKNTCENVNTHNSVSFSYLHFSVSDRVCGGYRLFHSKGWLVGERTLRHHLLDQSVLCSHSGLGLASHE